MQKKKILGTTLFFAMFASAATVAAETYTGDSAMPAALCNHTNMSPSLTTDLLAGSGGGNVYCGLPLDADLGTLDEVFIHVTNGVSACTLRNSGSVYNPDVTDHSGGQDTIRWTTNRSVGLVHWGISCAVPAGEKVFRYYVDQD